MTEDEVPVREPIAMGPGRPLEPDEDDTEALDRLAGARPGPGATR